MKKISVLILSMILVLTMVSCGNSSKNTETGSNSDGKITVTLDIDFPDSSNVKDVEDLKLTVDSGSTVFDVIMKAYTAESGEEVTATESDNTENATRYISSISGVAETDSAGWMYEVNDETIMKSADQCTLKNGDEIEWSFESWSN